MEKEGGDRGLTPRAELSGVEQSVLGEYPEGIHSDSYPKKKKKKHTDTQAADPRTQKLSFLQM